MITNNKGVGAYRLLPIVLASIIVSGVVLAIAFRTTHNEKYKIFRYNAKMLALNTEKIIKYRGRENVSLLELTNAGYHAKIKNPFLGEDFCDPNESFVSLEKSQIHVTLRCGNYLINDQYIGEKEYDIYQITKDWQEEKPSGNKKNIDTKLMYNYQEDNEMVNTRFYDEAVFLYKFNIRHDTEYQSVDEIPNEFNIIERRFYRVRKFVTKIKSISMEQRFEEPKN